MDTETKKYEISYVVSPAVPEDDVVRVVGAITEAIERARGMVRHIEEPVKRKIAYAIGKDRTGYFGYTKFSIDPASTDIIRKDLVSEKEVLRFMITEEIREDLTRGFRPAWRPQEAAKLAAPKREAEAPMTPEERKASIETIDKKLDEILGT